jgi:hypothetical protein
MAFSLRDTDAKYVRALLEDRKELIGHFATMLHTTDTEKNGFANEALLIDGILEALAEPSAEKREFLSDSGFRYAVPGGDS